MSGSLEILPGTLRLSAGRIGGAAENPAAAGGALEAALGGPHFDGLEELTAYVLGLLAPEQPALGR